MKTAALFSCPFLFEQTIEYRMRTLSSVSWRLTPRRNNRTKKSQEKSPRTRRKHVSKW
jgi:hypothetical protein